MQAKPSLSKEDLAAWTWLASKGISNAMHGLSIMIGQELTVTALSVNQYPLEQAAELLGGPEKILVGIYLTINSEAAVHLMLAYDPKVAFQLIDIQIGASSGVAFEMGEMEKSVMAELGKITGSYFLNALVDASGMTLTHSTPAVIVDTASTILGVALTHIMMEQDEVLVVQTSFGTANRQIDGAFLVMPTTAFLRAILNKSALVISLP
jgi:chemotaxis protein CheC